MTTDAAIILGVWIFTAATVLSRQTSTLFMLFSFSMSIVLSIIRSSN